MLTINISKVFKLAGKTLDQYDILQQEWRQKYLKEHKIYCRSGCGNCCNMSVKISLLEAVYIFFQIPSSFQKQCSSIGESNLKFAQNWQGDEDEYFYQFRKKLNKCPFLDSKSYCTIHRIRPLSCREILSGLSSEFCHVDLIFNSKSEEI